VVLAATARHDNLPAAMTRDGLEQCKKFLTSSGDGKTLCHDLHNLYK
jgi:hypothetical protein